MKYAVCTPSNNQHPSDLIIMRDMKKIHDAWYNQKWKLRSSIRTKKLYLSLILHIKSKFLSSISHIYETLKSGISNIKMGNFGFGCPICITDFWKGKCVNLITKYYVVWTHHNYVSLRCKKSKHKLFQTR